VDEDGFCEAGATTTSPATVPNGSPRTYFLSLWKLTVSKEHVAGASEGAAEINADDHTGQNLLDPSGNPDDSGNRQYAEGYEPACDSALTAIIRSAPCNLGTVRAAGTTDAAGEALDSRYYVFGLTEEVEDGQAENEDQTPYKGWTLSFDLVFQARVPAIAEQTPVYVR
jgi:hypothetical protein